MASFREFIEQGRLGPLVLGMRQHDVMNLLGEPSSVSLRSKPLQLKYGPAELTFFKAPGLQTYELRKMNIGLQEAQPFTQIRFTDFAPDRSTSNDFYQFLQGLALEPINIIGDLVRARAEFLSGVTVFIVEGSLDAAVLEQKASRESGTILLDDNREPSINQIIDMLAEGEAAARAGAHRAALLVAWAAVEACLRRLAIQAGRRGKIGVQPSILIRELTAAGVLRFQEREMLEALRQARTSVAHGLALKTGVIPDFEAVKGLVVGLLHRQN